MKGSLKAKVRIGPEHHHHHLARRHRLGAGVEEDAATFGSIKVGELGAVGPLETGGLEEDCYYFHQYHYHVVRKGIIMLLMLMMN